MFTCLPSPLPPPSLTLQIHSFPRLQIPVLVRLPTSSLFYYRGFPFLFVPIFTEIQDEPGRLSILLWSESLSGFVSASYLWITNINNHPERLYVQVQLSPRVTEKMTTFIVERRTILMPMVTPLARGNVGRCQSRKELCLILS